MKGEILKMFCHSKRSEESLSTTSYNEILRDAQDEKQKKDEGTEKIHHLPLCLVISPAYRLDVRRDLLLTYFNIRSLVAPEVSWQVHSLERTGVKKYKTFTIYSRLHLPMLFE